MKNLILCILCSLFVFCIFIPGYLSIIAWVYEMFGGKGLFVAFSITVGIGVWALGKCTPD